MNRSRFHGLVFSVSFSLWLSLSKCDSLRLEGVTAQSTLQPPKHVRATGKPSVELHCTPALLSSDGGVIPSAVAGWGFATPDGKPVKVPEKVKGWNAAWVVTWFGWFEWMVWVGGWALFKTSALSQADDAAWCYPNDSCLGSSKPPNLIANQPL